VIFVTLGTQAFQLDRLLRALDALPGDEPLVIQCGYATFRPARAEWHDHLSYEELVDHVQRARIVVCHAGVGSILTALEHGRRPVVVPRLHAFGEAVDDHQVPFARRLAAGGYVTLVEDLDRLPDALAAEEPPAARASGESGLVTGLRGYLTDLTAGE
jgi:beta-1,4-N-acetylglucosaminyltransferase